MGDHYTNNKTQHELEVNQCIPLASKYANSVVPDWKLNDKRRTDWNTVYLSKMKQLTIAAGLRVPFV